MCDQQQTFAPEPLVPPHVRVSCLYDFDKMQNFEEGKHMHCNTWQIENNGLRCRKDNEGNVLAFEVFNRDPGADGAPVALFFVPNKEAVRRVGMEAHAFRCYRNGKLLKR